MYLDNKYLVVDNFSYKLAQTMNHLTPHYIYMPDFQVDKDHSL